MKEFKKAAVEKKAKQIEAKVGQDVATDNKSAVRCIARWRAALELCAPENDEEKQTLRSTLVEQFYKNAKYQPSWSDALKKEDPGLQETMEKALGTPAPRAKKGPPAPEQPAAAS